MKYRWLKWKSSSSGGEEKLPETLDRWKIRLNCSDRSVGRSRVAINDVRVISRTSTTSRRCVDATVVMRLLSRLRQFEPYPVLFLPSRSSGLIRSSRGIKASSRSIPIDTDRGTRQEFDIIPEMFSFRALIALVHRAVQGYARITWTRLR